MVSVLMEFMILQARCSLTSRNEFAPLEGSRT